MIKMTSIVLAGFLLAPLAAAKRVGVGDTCNNFGRMVRGGSGRIDRIFYRGPLNTFYCEIMKDHDGRRYPLGHYPILARLAIALD